MTEVEVELREVEKREVPFTLEKLLEVRKELKPFKKQFEKMLENLGQSRIKFDKMRDNGEYLKGAMGEYDVCATVEYDTDVFPQPVSVVKVYNLNDYTVLEPMWAGFIEKKKQLVFRNKLLDYAVGDAPGKRGGDVGEDEEV
jgi:hypothetical protein